VLSQQIPPKELEENFSSSLNEFVPWNRILINFKGIFVIRLKQIFPRASYKRLHTKTGRWPVWTTDLGDQT